MRRLLLKYRKQDGAALLSHREAMRAMEMALRRCELPMVFSEGFSPRPRMSFSPALPLGVAAEAEYLEVAVDGEVDTDEVAGKINRFLPQGLYVSEVQLLAPNMPKLSRWARYGLFRLEGEGGTSYLLLALAGENQGRLKDAVRALAEQRGEAAGRYAVTRAGLYASPEEVFEDTRERVFFYDGSKGRLKEIPDEGRTP
ncbi:MAG: TIGR03936 family radical SAM-associated protein [Actinomycetota bacterium]